MVYHLYRQPLERMLVRHCLFAMFVTCSPLRAAMVAVEGQLNWRKVWFPFRYSKDFIRLCNK